MRIRKAELEDIPVLAEIRMIQLQEEGQNPETEILPALSAYFEEKMKSGEMVEWAAEENGTIIATAAMIEMKFPPSFLNPSGRKGYIANMYTHKAYRRRGIARELIGKLEEEARRRGLTVLILHASEMGRPAYGKSGFAEDGIVMEKMLGGKQQI